MSGVTILVIITLAVSAGTVGLYILDRDVLTKKNIPYMKKQVAFGLIFGLFAIAGTEFGIPLDGAVVNIRDAGPVCAGLFFGPEAGIIAGLLGGIERWLCVYWGGGEFSRLACTVGTIFAGIFAAFVKKYLLEGRIPGIFYSIGIGGVAEVFHMLMLYLARSNEAIQAHQVITICAPIMIPLVAIAPAIAAYIIAAIDSKQTIYVPRSERGIASNIAKGILVSVIVAFVVTNLFEGSLQSKLAVNSADTMLNQALQDVKTEIEMENPADGAELQKFLKDELSYRHIGSVDYIVALTEDGHVLAKTKGKYSQTVFTKKEMQDISAKGELNISKSQDVSGNNMDYYYSHIKYKDIYLVGVYPTSEAELNMSMSVMLTALLEVVILAVVFLMMYLLIRVVVIKELNTINKDLAAITKGDLETTVNVRSSSEFASLSDDINTTVTALKGYISEAAAKVEQELQTAKTIQRSALPNVWPDDNRFELYASMLAAKEVGGDFYDFYPVGEDKYAFLIADVSGKGIPAAMFMMNAKSVIKSIVETGASPGVVFTKANEKLCADNEAEMFVTAWLGIMDLNTGHVVYANAGHNPPVIKKEDGTFEYLKSRAGFVLAGMEGVKYRDNEIDLEDGMSLFLYTDGVTEATDANNELFGEDRLMDSLVGSGTMNMRLTCKYIKRMVDEFVGEAPQFDDITMLAIKRKTDEDRQKGIVLVVDENAADKVRSFFDEFVEKNELSMKIGTKLMVIVDEIFSNIINYSGASISMVTASVEDGKIVTTFQDNGISYNPLEKEDPDITLSAEEREIGGLGIFMVKQMSEDVQYTRIAGKNILQVTLAQ